MSVNNFLPFCPNNTGTNLLSQSQYAAASDRTDGNQPGVASSKLVNKALRQSTFITAQLAQYVSDVLGQDVLDDNDDAALLVQLNAAFAPNSSLSTQNVAVTFVTGAGAAVISIKTKAGTDPSATDVCYVGTGKVPVSDGSYNLRTITAALSTTIPLNSTLGQSSGQASALYVYLLDNAGTLELAISHSRYSEANTITTVAWGAGNANSPTTIYSTVARSGVRFRLIARVFNIQASAGTWATNASQITLFPFNGGKDPTLTTLTPGSGTYYPPAGVKSIRVLGIAGGGGGGGTFSVAAQSGGGGGGGGGAYFEKLISNPKTFYTYDCGAGGAGGAAGNNAGSDGGDTNFDTMTATGGGGGPGSLTTATPAFISGNGGGGGISANGDLNIHGGHGGPGLVLSGTQASGGVGGGSFFSPTLPYQNIGSTTGQSGTSYGGGGGGGVQTNGGGNQAGGAGGDGIILIQEFYN